MIYVFADYSTCLFESIVAFMLFDSYLDKRKNYSSWVYICAVFILSLLIFISNVIFKYALLNAVFMISFMFIASFFYIGDIKAKLIISFFNEILLSVTEIIVMFSISWISRLPAEECVSNPSLRLLGIVISKLSYLIIAYIICMKNNNRLYKISARIWILFVIILFGTVVEIFLIFRFQYNNTIESMNVWAILGSLLILYSFFATLYLYIYVSEQSEKITAQKLMDQQLNSQIKYINEILLSQEEQRKLRHDLKNHLISLREYFVSGEYENGIDYIDNLTNSIYARPKTIKTGNIIVDAILSTKKSYAASKSIKFSCNVLIPSNLMIEPADLCILLGNALDNAIEACEKVTDQTKRFITINLFYSYDMLDCEIVNTAVQESFSLKTTKANPEEHGIGLSNISAVVKKYNGIWNIKQADNKVVLTFVLSF